MNHDSDTVDNRRLVVVEEWMNGKDGRLGASAKLEILWRSHVWLLCTLSGAVGAIAGSIITYQIMKLLK